MPNKPWHQVDGYTFHCPLLTSATAQQRVASMVEHMIEMTPAERVEYLDKWIPALRDPRAAHKADISAIDQHLVLTAMMTWRADNADRARAAA